MSDCVRHNVQGLWRKFVSEKTLSSEPRAFIVERRDDHIPSRTSGYTYIRAEDIFSALGALVMNMEIVSYDSLVIWFEDNKLIVRQSHNDRFCWAIGEIDNLYLELYPEFMKLCDPIEDLAKCQERTKQ